MARIRTIKPEFFRHEALYEAERASGLPLRLAFAGLWTACDRDGRFVWKPRALKLDALPYDDVDFACVLDALCTHGFIVKYEAGANTYGRIPSWVKHQHVNQREIASVIPAPDDTGARTCTHETEPVVSRGEGKGKEQEGKGNGTEGNGETRIASRHAPPLAAPSVAQTQSPSKTSPQQAGTRWPPDAIVPDDWLEPAERARALATFAPIDLRVEATRFANYWASKSGRDATKLDWRKTWINWVLNARSNANGSPARQSGKSQHPFGVFGACLEKERAGDGAPTLEHEAGEGGCFEDPGAPQRDLRWPARPA